MTQADPALYCGDAPFRPRSLIQREADGGIAALFSGRRTFWSYKTRVAIRAGCDVLKLRPGDEVLVPAYNCGSEVDPLVQAGLELRMYPVANDLIADPARILPLIGNRTKALYVTHFFGQLQPHLQALRQLCDDHGLRLIEDCALSLLSGEEPVEGRAGDLSVFCFHKFLPVLEGGALVVNAPDLSVSNPFPKSPPGRLVAKKLARAALANLMGPAGAQRLVRTIRGAPDTAPEDVSAKPELDDIPAHYYFDPALQGRRISRIALWSLRSFSATEIVSRRRQNWQNYAALLGEIPEVKPLIPMLDRGTCPVVFPVLIENRDQIAAELQSLGISATPWWAGFNRNLDWSGQSEAQYLKNNVLSLPLHQGLGPEHIDHITKQLKRLTSRTTRL